MIALTIAQLAHAVSGEAFLAGGDTPDTIVSGAVDTDSRLIAPGGVFVAKPGEATDGHLFVDAAVANGAAVAIVEHRVAAGPTRPEAPRDAPAAGGGGVGTICSFCRPDCAQCSLCAARPAGDPRNHAARRDDPVRAD